MDSLDLWRRVIAPPPTRDAADALLDQVLAWIGANVPVERVYARPVLEQWATQHGFSRYAGADLLEIIRRAEPYVDHPSALAAAMNDAMTRYA